MPWTLHQALTFLSSFAGLAVLFSIAAYIPYIDGILRHGKRPTISTWLSWLVMDSAILAGMIAKGDIAYQMVAYVIGVCAVLAACMYKRTKVGWNGLDTLCMGLVFLAVVLWYYSGDADIAIVLSLVAISIGCVPMFQNVIKDPEREPLLPWVLNLTGAVFGIFAIKHLTIAGAATPIVFAAISFPINLIIFRGWVDRKRAAFNR